MVAHYSVYILEKNYTISVINRTAGHESIVIYMYTYAYMPIYIRFSFKLRHFALCQCSLLTVHPVWGQIPSLPLAHPDTSDFSIALH